MNAPKRHHWWPLAQSRHWTAADGKVHVTRADGTSFRANPTNLAVESELYTRFHENGAKDVSIEEWFATTIDSPAATFLGHILDQSNSKRRAFSGSDPKKAAEVASLGFRVNPYIDFVVLPRAIRLAAARYAAALLVRHPAYLGKLIEFHKESALRTFRVRDSALGNMLFLYEIYTERIASAVMMLTRRTGSNEYVYADGGIHVDEPWRGAHGIPFDLHVPLTPDVALQILPLPGANDLSTAMVMEASNEGVTRQNRIVLGIAQRFVFSRQPPDTTFIQEHFGKQAPKNIGYRFVDGRLETKYDPDRT